MAGGGSIPGARRRLPPLGSAFTHFFGAAENIDRSFSPKTPQDLEILK